MAKHCPDCGKEFTRRGTRCNTCSHKIWRRKNIASYRRGKRERRKANPIKSNQQAKETRQRRKRKVFVAYGGCFCCWCGEPDFDALSVDHVENQGAHHRRLIGKGGNAIYCWLIKNLYPIGYQVLCMNCQTAKRLNDGVLPESRRKPTPDDWFEKAGCIGI